MAKKSAGILAYRLNKKTLEVFLVHPGGPFWKNKDAHSWSIPKGEFTDEEPLDAAKREFHEETGRNIGEALIELSPIKQKGGKKVFAWAVNTTFDVSDMRSNFFEMEWPLRSGKKQFFPEIDKYEWFTIDQAKKKMLAGQCNFLDQLQALVNI
jgi:predicted NUDIX family NTP pyrophosphohydrolase